MPGMFSGRLAARDFQLDLIPFRHFPELYRDSPILTVYIWGYCVCASYISHLLNFGIRLRATEFKV
jgi:hypothetical protein